VTDYLHPFTSSFFRDKTGLTMRAPDLGYAPRFWGIFLASSWFRQSGVASSHPKRVTRAVGQASGSEGFEMKDFWSVEKD